MEAKEIVKMLIRAYPNWRVDKETAEFWVEEIELTGDNRAEYNAKEYIRSGNEFPPPLSKLLTPNEKVDADKLKNDALLVIEQKERRRIKAEPPPWVALGITWDEYMQSLKKKG